MNPLGNPSRRMKIFSRGYDTTSQSCNPYEQLAGRLRDAHHRNFCNFCRSIFAVMILSMATDTRLRTAPLVNGNGKPAQERAIFRRWQRYRLNLPIRIIVCRDDSTRISDGRASDISEGGMLVFAGIELKAEDRIFIEFTPPYSSSPVRAPGVIRHRRGYNYGVEFMDETAAEQEQTERLRNLLKLAAGR